MHRFGVEGLVIRVLCTLFRFSEQGMVYSSGVQVWCTGVMYRFGSQGMVYRVWCTLYRSGEEGLVYTLQVW